MQDMFGERKPSALMVCSASTPRNDVIKSIPVRLNFLRVFFTLFAREARCNKNITLSAQFSARFLHFFCAYRYPEREISCPKSRVFLNFSAILSREI